MNRALVIALFSGFVVMLYELLVVRLATPWIGSSFTVWSGTMSLILFGLFIGNLLGGWRGDRHRNIKELASILVGIGITMIITQVSAKTLLSVGSGPLLAMSTSQAPVEASPFAVLALIGFYVLALIPALLMGMICPYLLSLFGDRAHPGQSSAKIFGLSSVGGILGTLVGGALLIPFAGVQASFLIAVSIIVGLAALLHPRLPVALPALILCSSSYLYEPSPNPHVIEAQETVYGHLEVRKHGTVRELILGSPYSTQSIDTATAARSTHHVWYQLPKLSTHKAWSTQPKRALILGLGAGTMVPALKKIYPGIEVHGVELDPAIVDLGRRHLGLELPDENIHTMDARAFVQNTQLSFDIIIADAYRPPTIPQHLASLEFFHSLRTIMTDESILLLNYSGVFHQHSVAQTLHKTMEQAFETVDSFRLLSSVNSALVAFKGNRFTKKPTLPWMLQDSTLDAGVKALTDDQNSIEILQELDMIRYAFSKL